MITVATVSHPECNNQIRICQSKTPRRWAKRQKIMKEKRTYWVELCYSDDSETGFEVVIGDSQENALATVMMITRGTLMASSAQRATAYNMDGFDVCSYVK